MATATSSLIGVNLTANDSTAVFPTGTLVNLNDGGQAMYVKASTSALSTYAAVSISQNGIAMMLTTTNGGQTPRVGFAQTSIATSNYGWVQLGGQIQVQLAAQCASSAPLFTTSTAGVLDDATVTAGYVMGLVSQQSISNATAATCLGSAQVHVGRYGGGA
jgi:hypothetical protein